MLTVTNNDYASAVETLLPLIGLPIAAGVLYPHFHILLSPILASAAMALSSVSVLANSLRLRKI